MKTKQSNKQTGLPPSSSSVLLGRITATLLSLLRRVEKTRSSTEAKNLSETCRNLVVSMAICADKAASLDDLAGVVMVKPDRKLSAAARHYLHLLGTMPTSRQHKIIGRDRVRRPTVKGDNHLGI